MKRFIFPKKLRSSCVLNKSQKIRKWVKIMMKNPVFINFFSTYIHISQKKENQRELEKKKRLPISSGYSTTTSRNEVLST